MIDTHVVVVLNWHGRSDTMACVDSVLEADPRVEVLVVDNGSYDGAIEAVAGRVRVHTLQLERNLGFTGGMNAGIRWALEVGATMVTVLNNDTIVPRGALAVVRELATDGRAVSPTVMYRDDRDAVWFGEGALAMPEAYPHHVAPDSLTPCNDGLRASEWLSGCCITASASTWRRVGMFDDRFFLNFEDAEWSLRARGNGVELVVACDARILHAVSASFRANMAALGAFYFLRNGMLFTRICGAGPLTRIRFLRRFAFEGFRSGSWEHRRRAMVILASAVMTDLLRRYGEAPRWLRARATRWARSGVAPQGVPNA